MSVSFPPFLDLNLTSDQRIDILEGKIQELRKTYAKVTKKMLVDKRKLKKMKHQRQKQAMPVKIGSQIM